MLLSLLLLLSCFKCTAAFRNVATFFLNNNLYEEAIVQPWFRVEHSPHFKILPEDRKLAHFGEHVLPDNDVYVKPFWTERELAFLPCRDRRCVCGFFGGDNKTDLPCLLPSGKPLERAVRKEIRMLTDEERKAFEAALNAMKKDGTYNRLGRIHKYNGVHNGPAFIVWHREFLKRLELIIRSYMPPPHRIGVPYWDSSLDSLLTQSKDSIMFSDVFLGEDDREGRVLTGPYANWTTMDGVPHITRHFGSDPNGELLSDARIDWIVAQKDINKVLAAAMPLTTCLEHEIDERFLEYSHNYVHMFFGGDMGDNWSASNDVAFMLHHSMIDHIFEMFRTKRQNRTARETEYPRSNADCFPPYHNGDTVMRFLSPYTNIDALSNKYTDNMYEYAPRPTCDFVNRDCGSKYLFCYAVPTQRPRCMARVRPHGVCAGFDTMDICFESDCVNGVCVPRKEGEAPKPPAAADTLGGQRMLFWIMQAERMKNEQMAKKDEQKNREKKDNEEKEMVEMNGKKEKMEEASLWLGDKKGRSALNMRR